MNRVAASVLATLVCGAAGCSGGQSGRADGEMTGTAEVAITAAPADGTCIQITANGFRTVSRAFDVAVGGSTVLPMSGLPLGTVIFSANATTGPCAAVPPGAAPNWVSDPVTATVAVAPPVNLTLEMHRNGNASVGVDFPNEPTDGGPSGDALGIDAAGDAASVSAVCGNGLLEPGEECDDGNTLDLDGCDSRCHYEVVTRFTSLAISGAAAPPACSPTTNALGTRVFTNLALGQLNPPLQTAITNGTLNVMTQFLGLTDLTGLNATGLTVGFASASPDPSRGAFPSGTPIDWSFFADANTVAHGLPASTLPASIASGSLVAGPGSAMLPFSFAGTPVLLSMQNAHLLATINASPAPNVPAPPPSKLAPGLVVFQTMTATGAGQGLCGNLGVSTLAQVPIPQALASGGGTSCSRGYTFCGSGMPVGPSCNSLLDVIVGGCQILGGLVTVMNPTQPDVGAGGTAPTVLAVGALNKVVLGTADQGDAYSSAFTFAANRAHFTGETCQTNSQCQTGQVCTAGVCK